MRNAKVAVKCVKNSTVFRFFFFLTNPGATYFFAMFVCIEDVTVRELVHAMFRSCFSRITDQHVAHSPHPCWMLIFGGKPFLLWFSFPGKSWNLYFTAMFVYIADLDVTIFVTQASSSVSVWLRVTCFRLAPGFPLSCVLNADFSCWLISLKVFSCLFPAFPGIFNLLRCLLTLLFWLN